ncbi:LysM peptidoglycan-binding domain-containing protein [uncultured Aquimarina sp.]|uniref:LysM peptidoglycan-binding domain-containing protein n=1 Tax=uncultured Aquimarina sp. TaxID=575652 RepID=UPI002638A442|nr:LysM peptidoglycan-binding domain-containing protein [uncultured Aquimarina sp.]
MSGHNQEAINAARQKGEARLKRIWDQVRWDEETNQITFTTNEPEEGLLDAYFAEKKEREVPVDGSSETESEIYTVVSGDNLTKIAGNYSGVSVEDIAGANPSEVGPRPNYNIRVGAQLTIPNQTPTITEVFYEEVNKGTLGGNVYIVVKGFALKGKEATIEIFEKSPYLLMESETPLTVIQYDSLEAEDPNTEVNKTELKAIFNDNGEAVVKIRIRPKVEDPDTVYQNWKEKFQPPKVEVNDFALSSTNNTEPYTEPGLDEFQLDPERSSSDLSLPQNGGYTLSMGNGQEDVYVPILDFLWLKVSSAGNNEQYEKSFLNTGNYFILQNEIAPWMEIAWGELGVYEGDRTTGGFNRVAEFFLNGAGQALDPINQAWCSSFTNWVFIETNRVKGTNFSTIPLDGHTHNPALAINWFNPSRYKGGVRISPDKKPPYGSVLIMQIRNGHSGHAAFVIDYVKSGDRLTFKLLGGNQTHRVQVETYVFIKSGSDYFKGNFKLLGYVLPKEYIYDERNEIFYQYRSEAPSEEAGPIQ